MQPVLQHGAKNSDYPSSDPSDIVSRLQSLLNTWAHEFSSGTSDLLTVDGNFGDETLCRVLEFQTHSLVPHEDSSSIDGVVGQNTWQKLLTITAEVSPESSLASHQFPWATQLPSRIQGDSDLGFSALGVAVGEIESDATEVGRNNQGQFVDKYLAPVGMSNLPWCAGFVSWCYMEASGSFENMPFRYGLGARGLFNQFEHRDAIRLHNENYQPIAGDLAVWSRCYEDRTEAGHVAIVYSYSDGVLRTIDGNKGLFPAYVKGIEHSDDKWVPGFLGFCNIRALLHHSDAT